MKDDFNEMQSLRVDGEDIEGKQGFEHACQHGNQFFPKVDIVAIDDSQDVVPLLRVACMHQVRENTHAVNAQILSKEADVVIDVPIHTRPHVLEDPFMDLKDSFMAFLRHNWVGALVQSLGEEDLISDVG